MKDQWWVKRPIPVRAWKWEGQKAPELFPKWARGNEVNVVGETLTVWTMEGPHHSDAHCYIVQGVEGELYICAAYIFEKTYEPLDRTE